jgi:hypothetical protein
VIQRLFTFVLLLLLVCAASAQTNSYKVVPGEVDSDGLPTSSAKFCVESKQVNDCYTPPSSEYKFGLNARAINLPQWKGLTIFTAEFYGGGSGTLTSIALFDLRRAKLTNLLPDVALTNQSEYHAWNIPEVSAMPVFVTADFNWESDETHFGMHRYTVSTYLYNGERYIRANQYLTSKKYPGLDDADRVNVLENQRTHILNQLRQQRKQR